MDTNAIKINLSYASLVILDDRDGNYLFSAPQLFPGGSVPAIEYAVDSLRRFLKSEWGKDFRKWYPIKRTVERMRKELAEAGEFVMMDDSGNFRRIYSLHGIVVPVALVQE